MLTTDAKCVTTRSFLLPLLSPPMLLDSCSSLPWVSASLSVSHVALPLALRQEYPSTYTITGCVVSADCGVYTRVPAHCTPVTTDTASHPSHCPGGMLGRRDTDPTLFIEVKGRIAGADSVTLTANEIRCANNVPETFRLAVVQVEGDTAAAPVYVSGYDFGKPGFAQTSSTYPLHSLLQYGSDPA